MKTMAQRDEKQIPPFGRNDKLDLSNDDGVWARGWAAAGAVVWAGMAVLARTGVVRVGAIELLFLFAPLVDGSVGNGVGTRDGWGMVGGNCAATAAFGGGVCGGGDVDGSGEEGWVGGSRMVGDLSADGWGRGRGIGPRVVVGRGQECPRHGFGNIDCHQCCAH